MLKTKIIIPLIMSTTEKKLLIKKAVFINFLKNIIKIYQTKKFLAILKKLLLEIHGLSLKKVGLHAGQHGP